MRAPTFHHERELIAAGHLPIGVDEAGCGCLAGPVVAAACHLPLDSRMGEIRDSKLLSAAQRERLFEEFRRRGYRWAVGVASVEEIDRLNIRQATLLAMRRAVEALLFSMSLRGARGDEAISSFVHEPRDCHGPIAIGPRNDGMVRCFALVDAWHIPSLSIPQRGIVHGDRLVKSIAAASIIAKVTRDAFMDEIDVQSPKYGFKNHRGYATDAHREAIRKFGTSVNHRLTFRLTEG